MSAGSAEPPGRLVLDAGPLIALLHRRDPDHTAAVAGFGQLAGVRARLLTPLPIVFEVYKWLVYETHGETARLALERMRRSLEILYPGADDFDEVTAILTGLPSWGGTLEDTLVALTGLQLGAPV